VNVRGQKKQGTAPWRQKHTTLHGIGIAMRRRGNLQQGRPSVLGCGRGKLVQGQKEKPKNVGNVMLKNIAGLKSGTLGKKGGKNFLHGWVPGINVGGQGSRQKVKGRISAKVLIGSGVKKPRANKQVRNRELPPGEKGGFKSDFSTRKKGHMKLLTTGRTDAGKKTVDRKKFKKATRRFVETVARHVVHTG